MAIQISNHWPLMAMNPARESSLQEQPAAEPSPQDSADAVIHVERVDSDSVTFWEKGTFVDLYI